MDAFSAVFHEIWQVSRSRKYFLNIVYFERISTQLWFL